jgi:hypothetical protein
VPTIPRYSVLILICISAAEYFNLLTYNSHRVHYVTARKSCTAGTFLTLENVCQDCPIGTWSKDCATKCRPCGKGKVREKISKLRHSDSLFQTTKEQFLHLYLTSSRLSLSIFLSSHLFSVPLPFLLSFPSVYFSLKVSCARSAACTACTPGTYADRITNYCVPCPANTYAKAKADVCTSCPLCMYSALGEAICHRCNKGYKLNAERTGCQLVNPIGTPSTRPPATPLTTPSPTATLTQPSLQSIRTTPPIVTPLTPPAVSPPTVSPTPLPTPAPTSGPITAVPYTLSPNIYTPSPTIINTPQPTPAPTSGPITAVPYTLSPNIYTPSPTIINTPRPTLSPTLIAPYAVVSKDCGASFYTRFDFENGKWYVKCVKCAPGSYTSGPSAVCFTCPVGLMVNAQQTSCVDIGPTATPTPSPNNEVPVLPFPTDCLPSFYVFIYFYNGSQGQYCEKCPPGSYSSVASTVCSACPAGSMVNTEQTGCSLPGSPSSAPPFSINTPYPTIINTPAPTSAAPIIVVTADCIPSFHTRDYYVNGIKYEKCVKCAPGSYTSGPSAVCFTCPVGLMVNAEQTGCVDIGPTATPTPSPNNEVPVLPFPIDCLPSFYVVINFSGGSQGQYCEKCPPGSYSSVASTVCSTCPAGSMVNAEQTGCRIPGSPTFSPSSVPTSAAPFAYITADCIPSFYTRFNFENGNKYEKCVKCAPGSYTSGPSAVCFTCPVGLMVNAEQTGCVDIGPTATPTPSPNNEVPVLPFPIDCLPSFYVVIYFSYGSQGQYCEKCPPGSYSSVASTVCSTCPAGSMVNTEQTECSLPGSPTFSPTSAAPSYALSQRPLLRTLASS